MNDLERIIAEMREQADKDKARSWPTAEKKHRDWADRLAALAGAGEFGHAPGCVSASADHPYSPVLSCCRPALAGAAPDWVTVPRVPTDAMLDAADAAVRAAEVVMPDGSKLVREPTTVRYRAMLAAAPHAPAKAREDELLHLLHDMWEELVGAEGQCGQRPDDALRDRYNAALATFAEGD